jgi:hypothetical protein
METNGFECTIGLPHLQGRQERRALLLVASRDVREPSRSYLGTSRSRMKSPTKRVDAGRSGTRVRSGRHRQVFAPRRDGLAHGDLLRRTAHVESALQEMHQAPPGNAAASIRDQDRFSHDGLGNRVIRIELKAHGRSPAMREHHGTATGPLASDLQPLVFRQSIRGRTVPRSSEKSFSLVRHGADRFSRLPRVVDVTCVKITRRVRERTALAGQRLSGPLFRALEFARRVGDSDESALAGAGERRECLILVPLVRCLA